MNEGSAFDGLFEALDLYWQGRLDDARARLDSLEEDARIAGLPAWVLLFQAYGEIMHGNLRQAREVIRQALALVDSNDRLCFLLCGANASVSLLGRDVEEMESAIHELQRIIRLCPTSERVLQWSLHFRLAGAFVLVKRFGDAISYHERAAQFLPEGDKRLTLTYSGLSVAQFLSGRYCDARTSLERAHQTDPGRCYAFEDNNMGFLDLFIAREYGEFLGHGAATALRAEAARHFDDAFGADPEDPVLLYNLGIQAYELGDLAAARDHFVGAESGFISSELAPFEAVAGALGSILMRRICEVRTAAATGTPDASPAHPRATEELIAGARAFLAYAAYDAQLLIPGLSRELSLQRQSLSAPRTCALGQRNANRLFVLKRWNSYTPFVPLTRDSRGKGGGYFLTWNGGGVVIDPGFDFVQNLHDAGLSLEDVDAVVVTHAHLDHTMDLDPLLTLLHQRGKDAPERSHAVRLFLNVGSAIRNIAWLANLSTKVAGSITVLYPGTQYEITSDIRLRALRAYHDEILGKDFAVGVKFHLLSKGAQTLVLGITSDTRWEESLLGEYSDSDAVVAHVGSIDFREIAGTARLGIGEDSFKSLVGLVGRHRKLLDDRILKDLGFESIEQFRRVLVDRAFQQDELLRKQHLGYTGMHRLAEGCRGRARLFVVSEFGEELGVFRGWLAQSLAASFPPSKTGQCTSYLTADIGLQISLPSLQVQCNVCHEFHDPALLVERCLAYDDKRMVWFCRTHNESELSDAFAFRW
jgi:tetratricopeptide (TPR) repeat protein